MKKELFNSLCIEIKDYTVKQFKKNDVTIEEGLSIMLSAMMLVVDLYAKYIQMDTKELMKEVLKQANEQLEESDI